MTTQITAAKETVSTCTPENSYSVMREDQHNDLRELVLPGNSSHT